MAELRRRGHRRLRGLARLDEPTGVALIVVDAAGENQIAVASGANAELVVDCARRPPATGVVLLCHEVSEEVVIGGRARAPRPPAGASC